MPAIVKWDVLPLGQLAVLFHSINSIGLQWGRCDDAEERNYNFLKSIKPSFEETYIQSFVSGSFKPEQFIHPFEEYFTTSGKDDIQVLPELFATTDMIAKSWKDIFKQISPEVYLSYVYMFFLVTHPFVDGNGRVARNLLDYYNIKLQLNLKDVWNNISPKFAKEQFHKDAFKDFFETDLGITKVVYKCVNSHKEIAAIQVDRKIELMNMSEHMITALRNIKAKQTINFKGISTMAKGIMFLQNNQKG